MTVADRTTPSQKPSWLARLRGTPTHASPAVVDGDARKAPGDIADLLVMSAVDQKVPAEAPGSADVLDAMIKDNQPEPLATDVASLAQPAEAALAEPDAAADEISNEQRVNLLQREIETLLRDTPEIADDAAPPPAWPAQALDAISPMPVGEPPIAIPHEPEPQAQEANAEAVTPSVSAAELDVLLEREADAAADDMHAAMPAAAEARVAEAEPLPTTSESPMPAAAVPAPPVAEMPIEPAAAAVASPAADATPPEAPATAQAATPANDAAGPQSAASISEKIFAEQLDRLMASTAGAAAAAMPVDETHEKLTEAEGVLAEELAQLISESTSSPAANGGAGAAATPAASDAAAEPSAGAIAGETISAATAAAPAAAPSEGAAAAPAATLSADAHAEAAEATPEHAPLPAKGLLARIRRFAEGIALMVLQLIDLPFGWISELDKNVIGVAAFLLLLGGVVLYVMSRYM